MNIGEVYIFKGGNILGGESLIENELYVVCEMHNGKPCVVDINDEMKHSVCIYEKEQKFFERAEEVVIIGSI